MNYMKNKEQEEKTGKEQEWENHSYIEKALPHRNIFTYVGVLIQIPQKHNLKQRSKCKSFIWEWVPGSTNEGGCTYECVTTVGSCWGPLWKHVEDPPNMEKLTYLCVIFHLSLVEGAPGNVNFQAFPGILHVH